MSQLSVGNAGPNTAADQSRLSVSPWLRDPSTLSVGAADADPSGLPGCTHDFVAWPARRGRWLSYSASMTVTATISMTVTATIHQNVLKHWPGRWSSRPVVRSVTVPLGRRTGC